MSESLGLNVVARDCQKDDLRNIRKAGMVPATIYGEGIKSICISIQDKEFRKIYRQVGKHAIIDLEIDNNKSHKHKVLIKQIQVHPVTNNILNIEFHKVDLKKEINASIPVVIKGEAPAVKTEKGVLLLNLKEIKVSCLPQDLMDQIEIDISILTNFDKAVFIKDLKIPPKINILEEKDTLVVKVLPPMKESEEETTISAESVVTEPELVKDKNKETEPDNSETQSKN